MIIPKFRCWTGERIAKVDKINFVGNWVCESPSVVVEGSCDLIPLDEVILMQSTGLKDKNGVEIFEGDIVRSNWYDCDNNSYRKKGEVVFVGAQFVIAYDSQFDLETGEIEYDAHSLSYAENPEVIGNIYENSDLLEVAD